MNNNIENTEKYPFLAWDWDAQKFKIISETNIIDAIWSAWNYEFSVHESQTKDMIFNPRLDNDWNNELLKKYDIELINENGKRKIKDKITGIVHPTPWHKEN